MVSGENSVLRDLAEKNVMVIIIKLMAFQKHASSLMCLKFPFKFGTKEILLYLKFDIQPE